jgi:hypothetical protein
MSRLLFALAILISFATVGGASAADTYGVHTVAASGNTPLSISWTSTTPCYGSAYVHAEALGAYYSYCTPPYRGFTTYLRFTDDGVHDPASYTTVRCSQEVPYYHYVYGSMGQSKEVTSGDVFYTSRFYYDGCGNIGDPYHNLTVVFSEYPPDNATGYTCGVSYVAMYINSSSGVWVEAVFKYLNDTDNTYDFPIHRDVEYRLVFSDGGYYDFVCDGDEVFDYDTCIYVYGYTCGVDSTRLYKYDGGWVLDESVSHYGDYNMYEFMITNGTNYLISFAERGFVCYNETFSCTGSHVLIDFDRCQWVYPPSAGPEAIYLWAGYDYNIVIMKDAHGNFIENSQVAIYDKTDDTHIYKWADTPDGYLLLGTKFDTDHDVQITARTFDGVFTLNTVFPANGTPLVGEEDIAITNWTIPIMYNLGLQTIDQTGKPVFDVFCGLVEYTPHDPMSFWGMDLSDRGYVPVTNCSGFAMCDIVAEKDGYTDYNVSMINWTSRSAMVKDYRHNIVMEVE